MIITPKTALNDVKIIEKSTVYQGFLRVNRYLLQHRLFDGNWSQPLQREVFEKPGAACALLYDPYLDCIVLLKQFRIGALADNQSPWLIELAAGVLEPDETPEILVKRETQEEAGLKVSDLHLIYQYWVTPGVSSEKVTLFCAKVDASQAGGVHGLPEEGEDIESLIMTPEQAYAGLTNGEIRNAPTIIALQWLQMNRSWLRKKWGCF